MTAASSPAPAVGDAVSLRVRLKPWMTVVVLASTLAMGAAGYLLAKGLSPSHVATVDLLVLPNERGAVDEALVRTFESILSADAFAAEIKDAATDPTVQNLSAAEVAESIATTRSPTSSLIEVQVTRPNPASARAIAVMISPTVDTLLTVGGVEASSFYQQVFPEPLLSERRAVPASLAAAIGGFLGFVLGSLGVVLWTVRRPVVTSTEHMQELSGYPVIARLPDPSSWWRRRQPNLLDPLAAAVEQVRDTGVITKGGVVAVVSPEEGPAVTFAIEFASLMAQHGDRPVYLVDGNYRTAELTGRLRADQVPGWDTVQWDDRTTAPLMPDDVLDSFPLVPSDEAGSVDAQAILVPVSRLGGEQDRVTVERLRNVLDALSAAGVVIVACPPVPGDVPAAPAIRAASAVLIVARPGHTAPDDMELVGEMVASLSDAPAGVVVIGSQAGA